MRDVTETRGLGDIRTAASHHVASKPPLKGTAYLDLYLLDREKQRLGKELSRLKVRQKRIQERLGEIQKTISKLDETAQREKAAQGPSASPIPGHQQGPSDQWGGQPWKKLPVEY